MCLPKYSKNGEMTDVLVLLQPRYVALVSRISQQCHVVPDNDDNITWRRLRVIRDLRSLAANLDLATILFLTGDPE